MKNWIILIIGIFLQLLANSQQTVSLSKINTVAQAEKFIEENPRLTAKLFKISSGKDTSEILKPLYGKKSGLSFQIDNNLFKLLQVDSTLSFRVWYIYLSGAVLTKQQIDSIRNDIITRYKSGTTFFDLSLQYNMDGNIGGDTGWFTEGMMAPEFETAVKSHKAGEIFTVDIPSQNWYHVVLKTFDDTYIKTLTLLKLNKSPK